jgi:hypothetical protein
MTIFNSDTSIIENFLIDRPKDLTSDDRYPSVEFKINDNVITITILTDNKVYLMTNFIGGCSLSFNKEKFDTIDECIDMLKIKYRNESITDIKFIKSAYSYDCPIFEDEDSIRTTIRNFSKEINDNINNKINYLNKFKETLDKFENLSSNDIAVLLGQCYINNYPANFIAIIKLYARQNNIKLPSETSILKSIYHENCRFGVSIGVYDSRAFESVKDYYFSKYENIII